MQDIADTIRNNTFENTQVYKNYPNHGQYIKNYFTIEYTNHEDYFYNNATCIGYVGGIVLFFSFLIYGCAYVRSYYVYANNLL